MWLHVDNWEILRGIQTFFVLFWQLFLKTEISGELVGSFGRGMELFDLRAVSFSPTSVKIA